MNKLTGFILIFIIGGILVGWKEYEKRARGDVQKSLSSQKLMSVEQSPLTLVQRTQVETMAKLERSKIRVMVEHDNSPITDTNPMILDGTSLRPIIFATTLHAYPGSGTSGFLTLDTLNIVNP